MEMLSMAATLADGAVAIASSASLPNGLILACAISALFSTLLSMYSINSHLRAYRKPALQRYVVRLLLMVPIYSLSSLASITSLDGAFFIDLVRDIYEAFVIYCFFSLLVEYLGGERSLIILAHGRPPTPHPFPFNLLFKPMDVSDPYTFLALKRGILQYVQVKPVLAVATVVLKSLDHYEEGKLSFTNGYSYVSFIYNLSVFVSLYCLAMFWACLSEDLTPFRVTSKFLCIKGIIFFSFWQGLGISILANAGAITRLGTVTDEAQLAIAVQDVLISLEMPLFALGHMYAFSPSDYEDPFAHYAARLPALYALRDATGGYDVISDSVGTVSGRGYGYQTFEPSEGVVHQGLGRVRRSRAGLRYTQGGKAKYWLPQTVAADGSRDGPLGTRHRGPGSTFRQWLDRRVMAREGYAPLLVEEAADVVHTDSDPDVEAQVATAEGGSRFHIDPREAADAAASVAHRAARRAERAWDHFHAHDGDSDSSGLEFHSPDEEGETLFEASRKLTHGDYAYPTVDVAREQEGKRRASENTEAIKRHKQRKEQKSKVGRVLGFHRSDKGKENEHGRKRKGSTYGAMAEGEAIGETTEELDADDEAEAESSRKAASSSKAKKQKKNGKEQEEEPREGIVDILVEDKAAEERQRLRERRRGDPALRAGQHVRIFRRQWEDEGSTSHSPGSADSASKLGLDAQDGKPHPDQHARIADELAAEDEDRRRAVVEGEEGELEDPQGKIETAELGEPDQVAVEIEAPVTAPSLKKT